MEDRRTSAKNTNRHSKSSTSIYRRGISYLIGILPAALFAFLVWNLRTCLDRREVALKEYLQVYAVVESTEDRSAQNLATALDSIDAFIGYLSRENIDRPTLVSYVDNMKKAQTNGLANCMESIDVYHRHHFLLARFKDVFGIDIDMEGTYNYGLGRGVFPQEEPDPRERCRLWEQMLHEANSVDVDHLAADINTRNVQISFYHWQVKPRVDAIRQGASVGIEDAHRRSELFLQEFEAKESGWYPGCVGCIRHWLGLKDAN